MIKSNMFKMLAMAAVVAAAQTAQAAPQVAFGRASAPALSGAPATVQPAAGFRPQQPQGFQGFAGFRSEQAPPARRSSPAANPAPAAAGQGASSAQQAPLSPDAGKLLEQARQDADTIARLMAENDVLKVRIEQAQLRKTLREAQKTAEPAVRSVDGGRTYVSEIVGRGGALQAVLVSGNQQYRVQVGAVTPLGRVEQISAQGVLLVSGKSRTLVGVGAPEKPALAGTAMLPGIGLINAPTMGTLPSPALGTAPAFGGARPAAPVAFGRMN